MNMSGTGHDPSLVQEENSYLALNLSVFFAYSLIPLAYIVLVYISQYHFPVVFVALITENYWGENATFFGFVTSAFLLMLLAFQPGPGLRRAIWLVAALVAGFIAFEEISWGMWLLDIAPPQWLKEINTQDELTIHNIQGVVDRKDVIQQTVASLLVLWSIVSIVLGALRKRLGNRPFTTIIPIFPLRIVPCAFVVAWLFAFKPFIKSEEIAELALSLLVLMWSSDLYAIFRRRRIPLLDGVLRSRVAVLAAVLGITAAFSVAAQTYFPQAINGRLTSAAVEEYPARGMMEQSRALFDYLFMNPRYMKGATLDGYDDLFISDKSSESPGIYVIVPAAITETGDEQ